MSSTQTVPPDSKRESDSPQRRLSHASTAPPGPPSHWLLGNLSDYRKGRLEFLESIREQYGTIVSYRLGRHKIVLVCEPEVLKDVLVTRNKDFGRSFSTRMLREFFGDGLLISEGKRWLADRRAIQPTFGASQIREFAKPIVRQTIEFCDTVKRDEQRDVLRDMQSLTMSIAAETLLGVRLADEVDAIHQPHELIRESFDRRMESMVTAPRWVPTRYNRRLRSAHQTIQQIVDRLIEQRRGGQDLGSDVLASLLRIQRDQPGLMSDSQIRDQVLTFLFAGHETTASLLGWVWYLLARHSEAEARLHAELDQVLGGRPPTIDDLPKLEQTSRILNETLRLYPSAYVMGRQVKTACQIGGYNFDPGTTILVSPWLMHRDARFYDDPLEFRTERWDQSQAKSREQFAWFPFGVGPRKCIGDGFAKMEAILIIAVMASRFRFQLASEQIVRPHASVTIRPSPAVNVICQPRT